MRHVTREWKIERHSIRVHTCQSIVVKSYLLVRTVDLNHETFVINYSDLWLSQITLTAQAHDVAGFSNCVILLIRLTVDSALLPLSTFYVSKLTANAAFYCVVHCFVGSVFYRAMHYSAKRGLATACRPSVRLSVPLSVCDVGGLWSHRSEMLETNCTDNLLLAQHLRSSLPKGHPLYSQGNMGRFWGDYRDGVGKEDPDELDPSPTLWRDMGALRYRAHRAVIFAIAQLSCYEFCWF